MCIRDRTRLEHVFSAVALNLIRLDAHWNGHPSIAPEPATSPASNSPWQPDRISQQGPGPPGSGPTRRPDRTAAARRRTVHHRAAGAASSARGRRRHRRSRPGRRCAGRHRRVGVGQQLVERRERIEDQVLTALVQAVRMLGHDPARHRRPPRWLRRGGPRPDARPARRAPSSRTGAHTPVPSSYGPSTGDTRRGALGAAGTASASAWRTVRRCTRCRAESARTDRFSSRWSRRIRSNCSTLDLSCRALPLRDRLGRRHG